MFPRAILLLTSATTALVCACGPGHPAAGEGTVPAAAPDYASSGAGSGDMADYDCLVVLRSVGRVAGEEGFASSCDLDPARDGPCRMVWEGQVDVDTRWDRPQVEVGLLYRTGLTGAQWYATAAVPVAGPANGFVRHGFRIDRHTPRAAAGMQDAAIELIPYLVNEQGVRIFDHNRVAHPLAAYELTTGNDWRIEPSAACTPVRTITPVYRLSYPDFGERLEDGPVSAGGRLRVVYDGRRLREEQQCLGVDGPLASTSIMMAWTFDGDTGHVHQTEVERYVEASGYACDRPDGICITRDAIEPLIEVPSWAESLQMWFYCMPGFVRAEPEAWKYDADQGSSYRLEVTPGGREVAWAGAWELIAGRTGETTALPEPWIARETTGTGWAVGAQLHAPGLTDRDPINTNLVRAFVESDALGCRPGAEFDRAELPLAATGLGPYGNNVLFRWNVDELMARCPRGVYRYRFAFTADGGQTLTYLGTGPDTRHPTPGSFRTLILD